MCLSWTVLLCLPICDTTFSNVHSRMDGMSSMCFCILSLGNISLLPLSCESRFWSDTKASASCHAWTLHLINTRSRDIITRKRECVRDWSLLWSLVCILLFPLLTPFIPSLNVSPVLVPLPEVLSTFYSLLLLIFTLREKEIPRIPSFCLPIMFLSSHSMFPSLFRHSLHFIMFSLLPFLRVVQKCVCDSVCQ